MDLSKPTYERSHILYQSLPVDIYGKGPANSECQVSRFVAAEMGPRLYDINKTDLAKRISTRTYKEKKKRGWRTQNKYLSKKIRRENNLDKLPKTGWDYASLQTMRDMWLEYMQKCCSFDSAPDVTDSRYANFHAVLAKCELTGANITVEKSSNPQYIGIEGTVVQETQQTFQVVTPKNQLKIILKQGSAFTFHISKVKFTIYGNSLLIRPQERCVKKLKSFIKLDL